MTMMCFVSLTKNANSPAVEVALIEVIFVRKYVEDFLILFGSFCGTAVT